MTKRLTYNEVKAFIEGNGCKLLSTEYKNSKTKLTIKCKCGNTFIVDYNHFKDSNKRLCQECSKQQLIKNLRNTHRGFVKRVYDLVGCDYSILTLYETTGTKLKVKHNKCGCVYWVKPNNFLSGYRCPRCANQNLTTEYIKTKINNKNFELVSNYKNSKTKIKIKHKCCNREFDVFYRDFMKNKECVLCKQEKNIEDLKLDYDFVKAKIEETGYKLLSTEYKNAHTKLDVICPKGHRSKIPWYYFYQQIGCSICSNKTIIRGINDISTTHPYLVKYFVNIEDTYTHSYGSSCKKVLLKCDNCNFEKYGTISNLIRRGFSCPKCGDGISYPEKIIFNTLEQFNILFKIQKTFSWSQKKRYDFYIPSLNCIIEAHGIQHYEKVNRGKTLEEEQENDKLKKQLAKYNGIEHYIVIDCRESDLEFIKNNILISQLAQLINLTDIDWLECEKYARNSLVKKACDIWNNGIRNTLKISKIMKLEKNTIIRYLKQGSKLNICDYDPKVEMIKTIRKNGINNGCKVICLDTGEIYNSASEAGRLMNGTQSNISSCCTGKIKTAYGLKWMYYDDYLKLNNK